MGRYDPGDVDPWFYCAAMAGEARYETVTTLDARAAP